MSFFQPIFQAEIQDQMKNSDNCEFMLDCQALQKVFTDWLCVSGKILNHDNYLISFRRNHFYWIFQVHNNHM